MVYPSRTALWMEKGEIIGSHRIPGMAGILLSTNRRFPAILVKRLTRESECNEKILFVCHGNTCRSPMAEFAMKDLVQKMGLASQFHIESAATSREETGNPVHPPARRKLAEHGISL